MEKQQIIGDVLTIQQMAEITGLSAHTLRYYERAGLMRLHVGRDDANGYRAYTQQHVVWVQFLKCLRATGMPIRDIQRYIELLRQGEQSMSARIQLLKQHQCRLEEHLREGESYLASITRKIEHYEHQYDRHQPVTWGEVPHTTIDS
jgi:DNA-binding transcriptional MerR regulator